MKKFLSVFMISVFIIFTLFYPIKSSADWVSDWTSSANGFSSATGGGYFQGRTSNYLYGGAFQARWPNNTISPFAINLPTLNIGCGGINIFSGGFGFVNLQYLVQQLQQIIQMAPAMAFNLAIEAISEALHVNMNEIKSLIDRLNGLNFNACRASQTLTTVAADAVGVGKGTVSNDLADYAQQSGWTSLYDSAKDVIDSVGGNSTQATSSSGLSVSPGDMFKACNNQIQNIISQYNGSFMQWAEAQAGVSAYANLIQATVGDIVINVNSAAPQVEFDAPVCPANATHFLEELDDGYYYTETGSSNGECVKTVFSFSPPGGGPTQSNGLISWVDFELDGIAGNMISGTSLTQSQTDFLQMMPFNLNKMLQYGVITGMATSSGGTFDAAFDTYIAKAYGYAMVNDLYSRLLTTISLLQNLAKNPVENQSGTSSNSNDYCASDVIKEALSTITARGGLLDNLRTLRDNAYKDFTNTQNEVVKNNQIVDMVNQFNNQVLNQLKQVSLPNR